MEYEKEFEINGKIYVFKESFYQVYKSSKKVAELVETLSPDFHKNEYELAESFKVTNERLEKSYPHYLERYNIEKSQGEYEHE